MLNTILYYVYLLSSGDRGVSDLSSLTKVQVATIKLHQSVIKSEINMKEALIMRKNTSISRGTHYRILTQAKKNVKQSLFTIAIAVQLGLLKPEDVQKLVSTVSKIPLDMDQNKVPEVIALLSALVDRIVML